MVDMTLEGGAEVNIQGKDEDFLKFTPLMYAVFYHDVELVKLLLEHGADITLKNGSDKRPIDVARERIHDGNDKIEMKYIKIAELIESYADQTE